VKNARATPGRVPGTLRGLEGDDSNMGTAPTSGPEATSSQGYRFKVQRRMCATCIYRPDSALDINKLERDVADPRMPGFFKGHRVCHHSEDACCRGFWEAHKDQFTAGQLAQRLNLVEFVDVDVLA
jgi:hypothetical protein